MAGVLQYSLGLATGNFIGNASKAAGAVGGITKAFLAFTPIGAALGTAFAGFTSAHKAVEGLFGAFANGARLEMSSDGFDLLNCLRLCL